MPITSFPIPTRSINEEPQQADTPISTEIFGRDPVTRLLGWYPSLKIKSDFISPITNVYCMGDSLTARGYYQSALQGHLSANWRVINRGIGGNRTVDMVSRFADEVVLPGDGKYCIVWGGINDILQENPLPTAKINLQAMYTTAKTSGMVVVAVKSTPFKGYSTWNSTKQNNLVDLNNWIDTAQDVDYVVDAYGLLVNPSVSDTLLPAYDTGDNLHYNEAGGVVIGDSIYTAIAWNEITHHGGVKVSGKTVRLNQDLTMDSSPHFKQINLNAGSVDGPPLRMAAGALSMGLLSGAIEYDGVNFWITNTMGGGTRTKVCKQELPDVFRLLPTGFAPSTGKGGEISFTTSDVLRILSYNRDNSTMLDATINGATISISSTVKNKLDAPATSNAYWGAGTLVSDASGNITISSDEKIKEILRPFTRGLEDLLGINPITYKHTKESGLDTEEEYSGLGAGNVLENIPEGVGMSPSGLLTLQDRPIVAALINAVKELHFRLEKLEPDNKSKKANKINASEGHRLMLEEKSRKKAKIISARIAEVTSSVTSMPSAPRVSS